MKSAPVGLVLLLLSLQTVKAEVVAFGSGANSFNMEFAPVGNPRNAADTTGDPNPGGSVPYSFNMGKYEVSRDMITKANAEGGLGITLQDMSFVTGGARAAMPATGISWNEAARFINWLNTSQGFTPAYKFATQPGQGGYNPNENISLWTMGDAGFNPANPFRNSQAVYVMPNAHEWYKAAYYDPNANGGAGGYWLFPTGSNAAPNAVASGTGQDQAVWGQSDSQGPADITLAGGLSPYGTMAQGGNAFEWEETEFDLVNSSSSSVRGSRGGRWNFNDFPMRSTNRSSLGPMMELDTQGFRVASIPESSPMLYGGVLLLVATVASRWLRWNSRGASKRALPSF